MDPVLDLLNKNKLYFTVSGRDYLIKCLNPKHEDSNPSFRIDRLTGVSHCFSCGFKINIFEHFGQPTNMVSIKVAKLKEKLKNALEMNTDVKFPCDYDTFNRSFRGISLETLKEFGAFYTYVQEKYADRIFFPIKDLVGKTVVFVGRSINSDVQPRYLNVPSGVKIPIFPVMMKEYTRSVILVEGIFDFLNLYDKGIKNAICCFGTNTLQKDTLAKLLPLRAQGIIKIYLMFDGDEAGKNAMNTLQPLIEECGFIVEQIELEDGTDPGDLDEESIQQIKDYVEENSSNRQVTEQD